MNFDFATILVLVTLVCGVIWAFDALVWAPKRKLASAGGGEVLSKSESTDSQRGEPIVVEYARSFFPILLAVLLLRSFVVEPFRIPSGSMIPTLQVGDFILVQKYAYGLRLPVAHSKILDVGEPQRGDVVVFRFPRDPSLDYIKRVVGLPGDHLRYDRKRLYINGTPVDLTIEGKYVIDNNPSYTLEMAVLKEKLGEVEHQILVDPRGDMSTPCLKNGEYTVPDGHYFVMGDNRDNSNDSRVWCAVPEKNLVGKAFMIWMNWNGGIEWGRIGNSIE